ncbi:MAG: hypothetical protein C6I00_06080 [Nitratiruptor sp.]|nr:hypothetical protein [Nitratiruptor sp.]NPA83011.1 hypothetical protein [Campylobacterota bacterium]
MIYFYVHTDNRRDLDRLRRSAALAKGMEAKGIDVYFMTTDFRAATYAKTLGIKRSVGIEDFRNIAQICQRGDTIIFDSDEYQEMPGIHQEMVAFFGHFIRISYDPNDRPIPGELLISPYLHGDEIIDAILIDPDYFHDGEPRVEALCFWGDADYEGHFLQEASKLQLLGLHLLEGVYFFADYEERLAPFFAQIHQPQDYPRLLPFAKLLLSASPQSLLEGVAGGARVLYWPKGRTSYDPLLGELGVAVWDGGDLEAARKVPAELLRERGVEYALGRLEELIQIKAGGD